MQAAGDWQSPTQLQEYSPPPEAPEYPPPPQPPRFLSRQDKERAAQQQSLEEAEVKPNIKPRRLATSYLGPPGLLRMIGSSDEGPHYYKGGAGNRPNAGL